MIKIIALCGKSASGKDTTLKMLTEKFPQLHKIVQSTTRPPREGEIDGVDYHFIDTDKWQRKDMINSKSFRGWMYGTQRTELSEYCINIGVFSPSALLDLLMGDYDVLPIYLDVDSKTRLLRSLNRENNVDCDEVCRRYFADERDFIIMNVNYIPSLIVCKDEKEVMEVVNKYVTQNN